MKNLATGHAALIGIDGPDSGGRGNQHEPRRCSGLAQPLMFLPDRAAPTRAEIAPDVTSGNVSARQRIFGLDARPVAFQFFHHQLSETREAALAHLRLGHSENDRLIGLNHDPGVYLVWCRRIGLRAGQVETQAETSGDSGGTDDEPATG